ncbi:hypothetical protein [Syntrophomonas curvata]
MLFELMGLGSIVYAIMQRYLYTEETSPVFMLAFIILLGYSYSSAERYLSCAENRFDLLTGIQARHILWAVYLQVWGKNLSAATLFPLILAASTGIILPGLLSLVVFPVAAALVACLFNILVNKYWKRAGAVFYLLFLLLWGGATALLLGFLLMEHNFSFAPFDNRDILFSILALCLAAIIIMLFSSTLSRLWEEAYLQNDAMNKNSLPFARFRRFCRLLPNSFIVKEWFLLWRNSITKVRLLIWLAFILICSFTTLNRYLYDQTLFLIIALAVWLFCYGELPATAWQNEGEQKSFYWLGGLKPSRLIAAKLAAFLPLSVLGMLTALFLGSAVQLSIHVMVQRTGLVFLLGLSAITIALAIASLGHNAGKPIIDNAILEQVPLTISAIMAVSTEFIFCAVVFLPPSLIITLSISIAIICLIGQRIRLGRIYYTEAGRNDR